MRLVVLLVCSFLSVINMKSSWAPVVSLISKLSYFSTFLQMLNRSVRRNVASERCYGFHVSLSG